MRTISTTAGYMCPAKISVITVQNIVNDRILRNLKYEVSSLKPVVFKFITKKLPTVILININ